MKIGVTGGANNDPPPPLRKQKDRRTIAYHLNSIMMGGMESHTADLACQVVKNEFHVCAIVPEGRELDAMVARLRCADITVHRLTLNGQQPKQLLRNWVQMRQLLRQMQVDIFHQQRTGPYHGKWACLAARAAGVPVVVATEHQAAYPLKGPARLVNRAADRLVDRLIVVSRADWQLQIANSGRDAQKISQIYNGISLERFQPLPPDQVRAERLALGINPDAPVIGSVARLDEQKGLTYLLRATARLRRSWPDLTLLLVGDGPYRQRLQDEAHQLGIADQICFLGYKDNVAPYFPLMDVFVLPSLWESFGLTLVEAMATCLPVVASRVDAIPEVVAEGQTGLLTPPADPAAIARAVHAYLADPDFRRQSGQAGHERAYSLFSARAMAERTLGLYEELMRSRGIV